MKKCLSFLAFSLCCTLLSVNGVTGKKASLAVREFHDVVGEAHVASSVHTFDPYLYQEGGFTRLVENTTDVFPELSQDSNLAWADMRERLLSQILASAPTSEGHFSYFYRFVSESGQAQQDITVENAYNRVEAFFDGGTDRGGTWGPIQQLARELDVEEHARQLMSRLIYLCDLLQEGVLEKEGDAEDLDWSYSGLLELLDNLQKEKDELQETKNLLMSTSRTPAQIEEEIGEIRRTQANADDPELVQVQIASLEEALAVSLASSSSSAGTGSDSFIEDMRVLNERYLECSRQVTTLQDKIHERDRTRAAGFSALYQGILEASSQEGGLCGPGRMTRLATVYVRVLHLVDSLLAGPDGELILRHEPFAEDSSSSSNSGLSLPVTSERQEQFLIIKVPEVAEVLRQYPGVWLPGEGAPRMVVDFYEGSEVQGLLLSGPPVDLEQGAVVRFGRLPETLALSPLNVNAGNWHFGATDGGKRLLFAATDLNKKFLRQGNGLIFSNGHQSLIESAGTDNTHLLHVTLLAPLEEDHITAPLALNVYYRMGNRPVASEDLLRSYQSNRPLINLDWEPFLNEGIGLPVTSERQEKFLILKVPESAEVLRQYPAVWLSGEDEPRVVVDFYEGPEVQRLLLSGPPVDLEEGTVARFGNIPDTLALSPLNLNAGDWHFGVTDGGKRLLFAATNLNKEFLKVGNGLTFSNGHQSLIESAGENNHLWYVTLTTPIPMEGVTAPMTFTVN